MVKKVKLTIPRREVRMEHLDCGWRIERYLKVGEAKIIWELDIPDDHPVLKNKEIRNKPILEQNEIPVDMEGLPTFSSENEIFVGIGATMTRMGPREVRFTIDEKNIEDAFMKFNTYAAPAAQRENEMVDEYIEKMEEKKIQKASPDLLKKLDEQLKSSDGGILLP